MILYLLMTSEIANRNYRWFSWVLFVIILILPFIAWYDTLSWKFSHVTAFSLFPLLGLWAWSIMWTHYSLGTLRILNPILKKDTSYATTTKFLVLGMIVLHPGLLIWRQWDKLGLLPPGSYYSYVGNSMKVFITFGVVALLLFLSFDILERFRNYTIIKHNWFWISISQMIAMSLIFVHSMKLGNTINGWFEFYWFALGMLLIPSFGLIGRQDWKNR